MKRPSTQARKLAIKALNKEALAMYAEEAAGATGKARPMIKTAPHDHLSERLFDDAARSLAALEDFADNAHECANLDSQTCFEVTLALSFRARTLFEQGREQAAWEARLPKEVAA